MTLFFNSQGRLRTTWRLLAFIAFTFALNIPLQTLLQQVLQEGLLRGYLSASIFLFSALISLYAQTRFLEKVPISKYGLSINTGWMGEFLVGCSIAAVQLVVFYAIMFLSGSMHIESSFWLPPGSSYSFMSGFFSELFSQLVGSFGEELFFRSFLFFLFLEALRRFNMAPLHNALVSSIAISLLFGLAHYSNEGATVLTTLNLAIDGMMLAIPFLVTGRLGMSLGIHFFWNLLSGAVFGAGVSGNLSKVSLLRIQLDDNLLTGGAFGPEGSVLIVLLDALAVVLIYLWWRTQNQKSLLCPAITTIHNEFKKPAA